LDGELANKVILTTTKIIAGILLAHLDIDAIGLHWVCTPARSESCDIGLEICTAEEREPLILILDSVVVLGLISSISHYLWTANE
jgi:hypothetical protein